ncbi:MAG: CHAT domain-containing protein [Acidobacteria bacterium]|nr:CHAT domain-containing protein [Acidobacteriota bacterium]
MSGRRLVRGVVPAALMVLLASCKPPAPAISRISTEAEVRHDHGFDTELLLDTAEALLEVEVEQLGVDVELRVLDPGGRELATVDGPTGRRGVERAVLRTTSAGRLRLQVRAPAPGAHGQIVLTATWLPGSRKDGEPRDQWLASGLLATRAARVARQHSADSRHAALELYTEALATLETATDRPGLARERGRLHHARSVLLRQDGDLDAAATELDAAAGAWRAAGDHHGEARALNERGLVAWQRGDGHGALELYTRALAIRETLSDTDGEAQTLANIGLVHHSRGEPRKAREHYRRALELAIRAEDPALEATLFNNLGGAAQDLGEPLDALEAFGRALELHRSLVQPAAEARALSNLGATLRSLGRYEEALGQYLEALEAVHLQADPAAEAAVLNNLGVVYLALFDLERSRSFFTRALDGYRDAGDLRGEAAALTNLAQSLERDDEPKRARELYHQALELRRQLADRRGEAIALDHLGRVLEALGDLDAAEDAFDAALALHQELSDPLRRARALRHRAEVRLLKGELGTAETDLETAGELVRRIGDGEGEAEALEILARIDLERGRLDEAHARLSTALDIVESLGTRVVEPELRVYYLAARHRTYQTQIATEMALHRRDPTAAWDRRALETSERSRARTLLDLLSPGANGRNGTPPALAAERSRLLDRLGAKAELRTRLLARGDPRAAEVEHEVDELTTALEALQGEIRRRPSPGVETGARPLRAADIQALLDPETVLLEYSLGTDRSVLWAVDTEAVASFELPSRSSLEASARRLHGLWSRLDPSDGTEERQLAALLSRQLVAPAAARLEGKRRLIVVADGALHYLPFAALPAPSAPQAPLVAGHEVISLPSATVLAAQRELAARAPRPPTTPLRTVAVLADPVFSALDPRLAGPGHASPVKDAEGLVFQRLAATRREAAVLAELVPAERLLLALDSRARRSLLTGGAVGQSSILHLATHGVADDARPWLSGLMLSRFDETGRSTPAFLGLKDVSELELHAELVVLSGCRTALGREVSGEGLLGLVRGFFDAGARRALASLWQVQDRSTAELMTTFYRSLLVDGQPASSALAVAQRALMTDPRWRDPYFWAAFEMQGDWR